MANADVIYAIAVQGASDAIAAFNNVGVASKKATEETSTSVNRLGTQANTLADAFKKVSRDIGTVGGQAAQTFTHAADEALSLVGMITGGGGVVAAISVAGVVTSRLYEGWKKYKDEQQQAVTAGISWWSKHNEELKKAVDLQGKVFGGSGAVSRADAEKSILASRAEIAKLTADIDEKEKDAAYRVGPDRVKRQQEIADLVAKRGLFETDLTKSIGIRQQYLDASRQSQRDALEDAKQALEIARATAAAEERKQLLAGKLAAEGGWMAKAMFGAEAKSKSMSDFLSADAEETDLDRLIEFQGSQFANIIELQRNIDKDKFKDLGDAALAGHEKVQKLVSSIKDIKFATDAFKNVTAPTFEAGMMVISSAMSVANKYLDQFGTINRDNWRDMLSFSKDKQAAFAAEAQAALWSLARQAAPKAIYENAEGIASAAAAAGEYGKGNVAGGVLLSAAAVGHYAASAAYGTIAVAAGGGSLAIGAARGKGGLVAASPGGGGGMSGGPGASPRSGGGGFTPSVGGGSPSGGGSVNITYVYEAGSINAADERATARTVADGVGNARGSWFERRRMERRV